MTATTKLTVALTVGLLLAARACSNGSDDDLDLTIEPTPTTAKAPTTTTEVSTSTEASAAEATTTTLSERGQAEAEIRQVVTDWYQFPMDTSKGEEGLNLKGTTGLLRLRILESAEQLEAEGEVMRSTGTPRIEITRVQISLAEGTAEVDACIGPSLELVDAETLEVIQSDNPNNTLTSLFQLQIIEGQWQINEWISSDVAGDPDPCEVLD
jgi:hypothetical protein